MTTTTSPEHVPQRHPLGLPLLAIVGLALLAAPRAVLHDLGIVPEGSILNLLLVLIPLLAWVVAVVRAGAPNPFLTVLAIGACYGVLLAGIHQVLWEQAFAGSAPTLGANLTGLDPGLQEAATRIAAVVSSLFTGVAVGAIIGLLTWAVSGLTTRRRRFLSPHG